MEIAMLTLKSYLAPNSATVALGCSIAGYGVYRLIMARKNEAALTKLRPGRVVVLSGCDSGLGLSMSLWAKGFGYQVCAGCLNPEGEGAKQLKEVGVHVIPLDLTQEDSIAQFREECEEFIKQNGTEFCALICNAAVMVFGEFFWQTPGQQEKQFQVNYWGAVKLTREFKSKLLENEGRLIIISSDCSKLSLPLLATYAASKAALESWAKALRLELQKYGVTVVAYQPGSFPLSSRICAHQEKELEEMKRAMSEIDKEFYGSYLDKQIAKCRELTAKLQPIQVLTGGRHQRDLKTLLEGNLKRVPVYVYETPGQKVLLGMCHYLPQRLTDWLIVKLMNSHAGQWTSKGVSYRMLVRKAFMG